MEKSVATTQTSLPPIPEDTFLAASALYGKGNIYLQLGDALELLVGELLPETTNASYRAHILPALLTIIQYVEGLTNDQVLEAVRTRLDLRYALHLPLNSPGMSLDTLCEFHQTLYTNPTQQQRLQNLLNRLVDFGLVRTVAGEQPQARHILSRVCIISQLSEVTRAMYEALETLAVADPEWLRQIMRPTWYDRYNRSSRLAARSFSGERWNARAQELLGDIQYLLQAVQRRNSTKLAELPEVRYIKQILQEQYLTCIDEADATLSQERMVTECNLCKLISETQYV